jgi:DNA-binding transcriptional LysR family regulator
MSRTDLNDLTALLVVAEEASFTRAAARLGISQSSLSYTITKLEKQLGARLLARTTRSVATTEAGERLIRAIRPALDEVGQAIEGLQASTDTPSGLLRITTPKHPAVAVLWPKIGAFLDAYPNVTVELSVDEGLTDVVTQRFDAGVRLGERVEKDMIVVRISDDVRSAVVGSPAYFASRAAPQTPHDLSQHDCVNYRQATSGGLYAWEFERGRESLSVRVEGALIFNDVDLLIRAALDGRGLAYGFEDQVTELVRSGALIRVLEEWCPPYQGFYLYYPSRGGPPALSAFAEAMRHRG